MIIVRMGTRMTYNDNPKNNVPDATTNATNAVGNASASVNQTASEVGANASNAINKTGEAVNATVSELGKNASTEGSSLLNQTEEVGKKIIGGSARCTR